MHSIVFYKKGYPLIKDLKKTIAVIERDDQIDVWIPNFGKISIPRDEMIINYLRVLERAKEEAEDFSRKMLSEYTMYVQTKFPDGVYKTGFYIDFPPYSIMDIWYKVFWPKIVKINGKYDVIFRSEDKYQVRQYDFERDSVNIGLLTAEYIFLAEVANRMVKQGYSRGIIENRLLCGEVEEAQKKDDELYILSLLLS